MPILDQYGNPIPKEPPGQARGFLPLNDPYRVYPARGLTPERLARILRQADEGDLALQAELFEEMEERDALLFSLLQTRKLAVVGLDWRLEPAGEGRDARRVLRAVEEVFWDLPLEDLMTDLLSAIPQGVSVVAVAWEWDGLLWRPKAFRWVHPGLLVYRAGEDRFYLAAGPGREEAFPYGGAIEHRYRARSGLPTRAGLMRSLAWLYLFKHYALKDWVVFAETYGQPYRIGRYDPAAGEEERRRLEEAVRSLGADAAGVISKDTEIQILEAAKGQGPQVYESLIRLANREMAQAVLGQTLTSSEGDGGSYALAKVHERVRIDLLRADARALAKTLREGLLKPFVAFNFGPELLDLAPYPVPEVEEERDLESRARVLQALQGMGLSIPEAWLREEFGVPAPDPQGPVLTPLLAPQERKERGLVAGQAFVDGLGDRLLEKAPMPGLPALLQAIGEAEGYEDLRRRLLALFPGISFAELAQLLEAALTLSELAGRWAQRQDSGLDG
ncbi:phage portal protein family protein [Thermus brockianus]